MVSLLLLTFAFQHIKAHDLTAISVARERHTFTINVIVIFHNFFLSHLLPSHQHFKICPLQIFANTLHTFTVLPCRLLILHIYASILCFTSNFPLAMGSVPLRRILIFCIKYIPHSSALQRRTLYVHNR